MPLFRSKSKKSGPLKALTSVFASEEKPSAAAMSAGVAPSRVSSSQKNAPLYASKDDLSLPESRDKEEKKKKKKKDEAKNNPYATVHKMWRPITMTSSVSRDEGLYTSFNNFDLLMAQGQGPGGEAGLLPPTGDLRNASFLRDKSSPPLQQIPGSRTLERAFSEPVTPGERAELNGQPGTAEYRLQSFAAQPPHSLNGGSQDLSAANGTAYTGTWQGRGVVNNEPLLRRTDPPSSMFQPSTLVKAPQKGRSALVKWSGDKASVEAAAVASTVRSPPSPVPSYGSTIPDVNGESDLPADYPQSTPKTKTATATESRRYKSEQPRKGRSVMESSHAVVSPDVSDSVNAVLARTFGPDDFERAAQDVETLLGHFKVTMETLKTWQAAAATTSSSSNSSQFQTVRQELQLQTKQFVQDAKQLVAGATGTREAVSPCLQAGMHTLARLLLHSQALMVRMRAVHPAQHLGFEVMKVSAAFKSTVASASAAIGRPTSDPHMRYLMRQATNLAALLTCLLKSIKSVEQA